MHVAFCLLVIDQFGDRRVVSAYRAVMVLWKFNGTESHRQCIIGKKSSCVYKSVLHPSAADL